MENVLCVENILLLQGVLLVIHMIKISVFYASQDIIKMNIKNVLVRKLP